MFITVMFTDVMYNMSLCVIEFSILSSVADRHLGDVMLRRAQPAVT